MNESINQVGAVAGNSIGGLLSTVGIPAAFANPITALIIFVVGFIIAKIIKGIVVRLVRKTGLGAKMSGKTDVAKSIGSLVYFVLILFVLLMVLEQLGLTAVLDPLKDLVTKLTSALPNIIGAGIVFYAGWIISNMASGAASMAAGKLDDQLLERGFSEDFKISKLIGALVLGTVLLPIVVAGLGILNIPAISDPATAMVNDLMSAVPKILSAGIILGVAYLMSKFIVMMLTGLLDGMNVNAIPAKMGLDGMFTNGRTATGLIGQITTFFIMLSAGTAAVEKLDIEIVSRLFGGILEFGGGIVAVSYTHLTLPTTPYV